MDPPLLSAMTDGVGDLRKEADVSQRRLAEVVGFPYSTTISQIEAGKLRIQPDRYEAFPKRWASPTRKPSSGSS